MNLLPKNLLSHRWTQMDTDRNQFCSDDRSFTIAGPTGKVVDPIYVKLSPSGTPFSGPMPVQQWRRWMALVILFCTSVVVVLCFNVQSSYAQAPVDSACRTCHGDSESELLLPSGESLPVLVHLQELDSSAHGPSSGQSCRTCHQEKTRYLYPHEALPGSVNSAHDYTVAASAQCENCHYPHNPFHSDNSGADEALCVDCHGNHDVAPFEEMLAVMPAKCLACHDDQPDTWASELFAERRGLGAGAAGYAGSVRCLGCHEDLYLGWLETRHAQTIHDAKANPAAILGDFMRDDPQRPFTLEDVALTVGGIRQQKYITQTAERRVLCAAGPVER